MTQNSSLLQDGPIDGVYLCASLDLLEIFGAALDTEAGLRLFRPEDVPDPSRILFALAWRPTPDAFIPYPNIRLVQTIGAGVDPVLNTASLPKNILVTRVNDHEQAAIMSGFAAWQVIWYHRKMGAYQIAAAKGEWIRNSIKTLRSPSDMTIGILGYGLMGQAIAKVIVAMGFPVLAASRTKKSRDHGVTCITGSNAIQQVAARAAILINVLPLTEATRDILSAPLFAKMPQGAALIHLGRGEHLIDEDLLEALNKGHLSGASLDVFRSEPLPQSHPFWTHPKLFITPHEASITSVSAVSQALLQSVSEMMKGQQPTNAINVTNGY